MKLVARCFGSDKPDRQACNVIIFVNFLYGCATWFASVAWGRRVLFRKHLTSGSFIRPIEYYDVAIGLLVFHAGALTYLLRDSQCAKTRSKLMFVHSLYWLVSALSGLYFSVTEVYRPEAGFAHALVALFVFFLSVRGRYSLNVDNPYTTVPSNDEPVTDLPGAPELGSMSRAPTAKDVSKKIFILAEKSH